MALLRPAGQGGAVRILWWRRAARGDPCLFGREVIPGDDAPAFIAGEGHFWVHTS